MTSCACRPFLETAGDLEIWLESFKQDRLLQPTKGVLRRCGDIHTDRDTHGELFEFCAQCHAELTAFTFERT